MTKIFTLGKNCRAYLKRYGKKRPQLKFICEKEECNSRVLYEHGRYYRIAVLKYRQFKLPIYRWRCPACGQTLSILPDFLVPWGHFVTPIREAALKRKEHGQSLKRIAKGIVSVKAGGISIDTIKRWWIRHLQKAGDAAQWLAGKLIQAGANEDLLRSHFQGVNPTPMDTVRWLTFLVKKYLNRLDLSPSLMGYFGFLNTRLPAKMWI